MTGPADSHAPLLIDTLPTASGHRFGRITLNAPDTLNALTMAMVEQIDPQMQRWADDPGVAGVFIDAAGDKAFCAGGDIVSLYRSMQSTPAGQVPRDAAAFFAREYRLDYRIHRFPKPVVCWGTGIVMGGGIGLLAGASHRVATPTSRLAMPEVGIGLYPDVGGSWLLSRMPGKVGLFLGLTGIALNASDALFVGLANHVAHPEQRAKLVAAMSAASWQGDRVADCFQMDHLLAALGKGLPLPDSPLRAHAGDIDRLIGDDDLRGVAARMQLPRGGTDAWMDKAASAFSAASPTSLALTFAMFRRARTMSLADVFRLEWQASVGCCMHADFREGIRALLVDKDKIPRWLPSTLDAVSDEHIGQHLMPHHTGAHPLADLT